jgi:hypothetical protein
MKHRRVPVHKVLAEKALTEHYLKGAIAKITRMEEAAKTAVLKEKHWQR